MRLLKRNCVEFTYEKFKGMSDLDSNTGEYTGEPIVTYEKPVKYIGSISAPSTLATTTLYGVDARYSHVLLLDDPKADISETGRITYKGDKYEIVAVRPTLNVLAVAMRKMTADQVAERAVSP